MWGPRERSLLSLCKHRTADFMPLLHKNPKDRATSWSTFLLPWTISTLEPKDLGCAIASWARLSSCPCLPLQNQQVTAQPLLTCSPILWPGAHHTPSHFGVMNSQPHTPVGHRLQPRSPLLPEEELGGRGSYRAKGMEM